MCSPPRQRLTSSCIHHAEVGQSLERTFDTVQHVYQTMAPVCSQCSDRNQQQKIDCVAGVRKTKADLYMLRANLPHQEAVCMCTVAGSSILAHSLRTRLRCSACWDPAGQHTVGTVEVDGLFELWDELVSGIGPLFIGFLLLLSHGLEFNWFKSTTQVTAKLTPANETSVTIMGTQLQISLQQWSASQEFHFFKASSPECTEVLRVAPKIKQFDTLLFRWNCWRKTRVHHIRNVGVWDTCQRLAIDISTEIKRLPDVLFQLWSRASHLEGQMSITPWLLKTCVAFCCCFKSRALWEPTFDSLMHSAKGLFPAVSGYIIGVNYLPWDKALTIYTLVSSEKSIQVFNTSV